MKQIQTNFLIFTLTSVFAVGLLSLGVGLISGWTSPYIAKLTSPDSPILVSDSEASWIVALLSLGRILGAILGAISVSLVGSKRTALYASIPQLVGWALLLSVDSIYWIYASRILSGVCLGSFFVCFPLYIGEVSDPKIRGALVALIMNCQPLGTLLGNIMGPYLSMWQSATISSIPNLIFLCTFLMLPESPHYLVKLGKYQEAEEAIKWYHRKANSVEELENTKLFVNTKDAPSFCNLMTEFNKPKNRKALIMANVLFAFLQISGLYTITFYMEVILRNAKVNILEPSMIVILVNTFGIVSGWIGMFAIDKCGRRILLALSSGGISLSMMLLSADSALIHYGFDAESIQWIPIVSVFIFQSFICIGMVPVPCTILSEIFSPNIKGYASSMVSVTSGVFSFISSKTYQNMLDIMPAEYVFACYGSTMFLLVIYCFYIPETKGKTLQEVQDILEKR